MADLPHVLERLIRRTNGHRREATYYRLAMSVNADPSDVVICDEEEVIKGFWAGKLDVALSPAPQIVQAAAAAILSTAREHAESRELAPRVQADALHLPPSDVGPAGYGQAAPGEDHARDAWAEIATIATRTPRLALTLGVALGGLYVGPLNRQSFVWFLVGEGGLGKTTALNAAAGMFGVPEQVAKPWNTTPVALVQELGTLSVLPAFRDELGVGGFRPADLEKLVFSIAQGGSRTTGGKTGIPKTSARWDGVMLSTGNDSILGRVTNEGAARRVIEVETPITANAEDSERIDKVLLPECYGWPLRWLQAAGLDVASFAASIADAEQALPLPEGGVPRGLGRHLALAVAGAHRLETITGITGMRDAALTEARALLDRQIAEIREHGITPAQRVRSAVKEAFASRPAAFLTPDKYSKQRASDFLPRDIEGWDLTSDPRPGDLAVMTGKLESICQAHGITNARTGLRDLARMGLVLRSQEADGRLRRQLRIDGDKHDVYVFVLNDEDDSPAGNTGDTAPGNTASPQDHNDGYTANRDADQQVMPDTEPATEPANTTDSAVLVRGTNGPVRLDGRDPAPCRVCGELSPLGTDDLGPVHPMCATGQPLSPPALAQPERAAEPPAPPAPAKSTSQPRSTRQRAAQPRRCKSRLALCGVLAAEGLWLPDADAPIQVHPPADIAAAYRLALANDLRQLWVHPSAHAALGIPETREITAEVGPATAVPHEWTEVEGLTVDADGTAGLAAWVNVAPADKSDRRIGIVFPAYDHTRTDWHTAADGRTLRDAVLRFAAITGEPFYMSSNETSAAMVRRSAGDALTSFVAGEVPAPAGKVHHLSEDSRALIDDEDGHTWAHSYDLNAAEASVNTGVFVGVGEPERTTLPTFDRKALKNIAGYVLANVPRTHANLDPRLPNLVQPWTRADERADEPGGPTWVPVETLALLDELGVPIETSEALLWSDSRRLLRTYGERMSKGRLELLADQDDPAAPLTLDVLKALYKSRIGDFNRAGSRIYRPDWRDMIKAKAVANGYRSLQRIAAATGRYPIAWYVDAALYTSDDPDPASAAPVGPPDKNGKTTGMVFGPAMGQWKTEPDKTLPLVKVRERLGERGFAAKLERIRNGRR